MTARTISVCIATHQRATLLPPTLAALGRQTCPPDEIIVADSSIGDAGVRIIETFRVRSPAVPIRSCRSTCSALPWLRYLAASHASGHIVLFLDDDVCLAPESLACLQEAYAAVLAHTGTLPAGIGFPMTWDDGTRPSRNRQAMRERWLGTARWPSGRVTSGGLSVSLADLRSDRPIPVDHLWGGAMSFQRAVLARIGLLDRLVDLYAQGVGRGEDAVLSRYAREHGPLYLLPIPMAFHRKTPADEPTPYATAGWRLGWTATWGRAHTLRWLATDRSAYRVAWARLATLELARSAALIVRRPGTAGSWRRLGGACAGSLAALRAWRAIPPSARSSIPSYAAASAETAVPCARP